MVFLNISTTYSEAIIFRPASRSFPLDFLTLWLCGSHKLILITIPRSLFSSVPFLSDGGFSSSRYNFNTPLSKYFSFEKQKSQGLSCCFIYESCLWYENNLKKGTKNKMVFTEKNYIFLITTNLSNSNIK